MQHAKGPAGKQAVATVNGGDLHLKTVPTQTAQGLEIKQVLLDFSSCAKCLQEFASSILTHSKGFAEFIGLPTLCRGSQAWPQWMTKKICLFECHALSGSFQKLSPPEATVSLHLLLHVQAW